MDRPLDKRRKVTWRISGTLMDPPDRDGDVIWIAEIKVSGNFTGGRHPTVQFMVDRKANGIDLKPIPGPNAPTPPFYMYTLGVWFRNPPNRDINLFVRRVFDEEGHYCARVPRSSNEFFGNYELDPEEEERVLGSPVSEGVWRAMITGNAYDAVHVNEAVWKNIAPYLLEMSKMPDMEKMDKLLPRMPEHEDVHTDTGYYESYETKSLIALLHEEEKLLAEVVTFGSRPLRIPPPAPSEGKYIEHEDVHTDNSESDTRY